MASVGAIYLARRATSTFAFKCYALLASAVALWQLTWVSRVFENWANVGLSGTWNFLAYAVVHTHLPVQIALAIAAAAGISILADAIRSLRQSQPLLVPR